MGRKEDGSRYVNVERGVYANLPQLRAVVLESGEAFVSLLVKQRGEFDYVVVVKRVGDAGDNEVIFGSGHDFVGALLGLEGSLAANRWRIDKPWKPG